MRNTRCLFAARALATLLGVGGEAGVLRVPLWKVRRPESGGRRAVKASSLHKALGLHPKPKASSGDEERRLYARVRGGRVFPSVCVCVYGNEASPLKNKKNK